MSHATVPKHMVPKQRIVDEILGLGTDLVAAYLFGSAARGEMREDSDVDVAILSATLLSADQRWQLQEQLAARLGRDVDLVDLRNASTVMQMQIVSSGEVIIDRLPQERHSFEGLVYSSYARLNEERRPVLDAINATGNVYGR